MIVPPAVLRPEHFLHRVPRLDDLERPADVTLVLHARVDVQADDRGDLQRADDHYRRSLELDPRQVSRATKEYLATLDDAAFGAAGSVTPKFVSPSDPAAQWTGAMRGPAFFAYSDNYLIDVKFGVIMDVEASRAIRQAEVGAAKTMIAEEMESTSNVAPFDPKAKAS